MKKEYKKPEMEIVDLKTRVELLQGSGGDTWGDDCDDCPIGSIPVYIDPSSIVGA